MFDVNRIELWKPATFMPMEILDLHGIEFSADLLKITLSYNDSHIILKFPNMIQGLGSFKCTSLSYNLGFNDEVGKWMEDCKIKGQSYPLFVTDNSEYIESMKEQTYFLLNEEYEKMKHYIIVSLDIVIEVICTDVPEVLWEET